MRNEAENLQIRSSAPSLIFDKFAGQWSVMTDMTAASVPPPATSRWRLFLMPVLLLVAAATWSVFWFYAASQAEVKADAWRAQEAKSGRSYDCAKQSISGYPF